jgi:alanyl aminopeptidase
MESLGNVVEPASSFCDHEHRQDAERFFGPRMEKVFGGPRDLALALEAIDLCIAQKKAFEPEIRAFLKKS